MCSLQNLFCSNFQQGKTTNQPANQRETETGEGDGAAESASRFNPSSTETELWGVRPTEAMESSPPTITVQVKFARRTIPVEVPAAATTAELKRLLQPLTNVLPRGQRLVCKGTDPQTLTTYLLRSERADYLR